MPDISLLINNYKNYNYDNYDFDNIQNIYKIIHPYINIFMTDVNLNYFIKNNFITKLLFLHIRSPYINNIYSLSLSISLYIQYINNVI